MPRKHVIPKDVEEYLSPALAAARLFHLATSSVLSARKGARIKWTIDIKYYYPPEVLAKAKSPAVAMGKFSSGPNAEEWD